MSINLYKKRYSELSKKFRESCSIKDLASDLFDLLYALQAEEQTSENILLQSHIYALLEYWETAYRLLLEVESSKTHKIQDKLFVFSEKAKSHKDIFGVKDLRKLRERKTIDLLFPEDITLVGGTNNQYSIKEKRVVIFNKYCPLDRFLIISHIPFDSRAQSKVIDYLYWLTDLREELIGFYNSENNAFLPFLDGKADDDWYDTLDLYSATIYLHNLSDITASITIGDEIIVDHIIDIEISNKECIEMSIDG
ncbi:hypothetical protein [Myroides profundi]|uniref:Uncharacterized protein n=1 Tax=Myroides profundi TaxID=480520 RepID=A0AAJ4W447_MYRPR|nr:hypothetical protein [Myroides profundi]AJH14886.1 hypothetical protein MPR_1706 [Myroides profundi]SEQ26615.1 hypothetical protein SAMN04488089_102203 [Myroides profundi]